MIKEKFLSQLPFVEVDSKTQPVFCVDGRVGQRKTDGPYLQALGGSYHFVILRWLLRGGDFSEVFELTLTDLKNLGYPLGLHRDTHASGDHSGCGFADNNRKIIEVFKNKSSEIWEILNSLADFSSEMDTWEEVLRLVHERNLNQIPSGEEIIKKGEVMGAEVQVLDGDHQEKAAIVNLNHGKTLDVDNNQDHQGFNLDLWYVLQVAKGLDIDVSQAKILSLGLYVATEMVLVEEKGKPRLPILINE